MEESRGRSDMKKMGVTKRIVATIPTHTQIQYVDRLRTVRGSSDGQAGWWDGYWSC